MCFILFTPGSCQLATKAIDWEKAGQNWDWIVRAISLNCSKDQRQDSYTKVKRKCPPDWVRLELCPNRCAARLPGDPGNTQITATRSRAGGYSFPLWGQTSVGRLAGLRGVADFPVALWDPSGGARAFLLSSKLRNLGMRLWVKTSLSKREGVCQSLSRVRLSATPRTAANQASLSIEFSRQEYWSWLPFIPQKWWLKKKTKLKTVHMVSFIFLYFKKFLWEKSIILK